MLRRILIGSMYGSLSEAIKNWRFADYPFGKPKKSKRRLLPTSNCGTAKDSGITFLKIDSWNEDCFSCQNKPVVYQQVKSIGFTIEKYRFTKNLYIHFNQKNNQREGSFLRTISSKR